MIHLDIDLASSEHIYQQIFRQVRQLIRDGLLTGGTRLPSMRELSRQLDVSVNTVHTAFDLLAAHNLITTRPGGGCYVTELPQVVTGANLRTRGELGRENSLPRMGWEKYEFPRELFLFPPIDAGPRPIDFMKASPDPSLYPFDKIKQTVSNMLWTPQELLFDSGHPQGYLPLIDHLEKEMALEGVPMAEGENDIIITSGFQRALSVLVRLLVRPGQKVAIEAPTYSAILNLLIAEGIEYVPIPMDDQGMMVSQLGRETAKHDIGLVITIPTYHNPTGVTMSSERRLELLELTGKNGIPVIEDDWGRQLRYEGLAPPPLKAQDLAGNVIHIGNFSKSFLPGLRLGWITCPSNLAETVVSAKLSSDQGDSFFLQALAFEFIQRGFLARHLRHSLTEYKKRRDLMCKLLVDHLPQACKFKIPQGGFTIWVELPEGSFSLPLMHLAAGKQIKFLPSAFCMPDRKDAAALRLSFSRVTADEIERGIPAFCSLLTDYLKHPATSPNVRKENRK